MLHWLLRSLIVIGACVLFASDSPAQAPAPTQSASPAGRPQPRPLPAQDGGVRELLVSILITPIAKAPFNATLQTEWVRPLADGGTITLINERRIARDTEGRIYQERWMLVPKNGSIPTNMTSIEISDPLLHVRYICPNDHRQTYYQEAYNENASTHYEVAGPPTGPLPNDRGYALRESLGDQFVAGVDATGTRESVTYNPGVMGNDKKLTVAREYWYAPKLDLNVQSKRSDPRFGTQTFTVANLTLSEPDAKLFSIPDGYHLENPDPDSTPLAH